MVGGEWPGGRQGTRSRATIGLPNCCSGSQEAAGTQAARLLKASPNRSAARPTAHLNISRITRADSPMYLSTTPDATTCTREEDEAPAR